MDCVDFEVDLLFNVVRHLKILTTVCSSEYFPTGTFSFMLPFVVWNRSPVNTDAPLLNAHVDTAVRHL